MKEVKFMKVKILTTLITVVIINTVSVGAANPFIDVPTDSWAYKSIVELADAGIIQGVDGAYFQGNRNITRYEVAELVAKALAHQDKATVEQRGLINKLADEYAEELSNLGVKISSLENKVGNVKLSGDARLRYLSWNKSKVIENDGAWAYRLRLRANAQIDDNTTIRYGLTTDNQFFSNNTAASAQQSNPYTDRAEVVTAFGNGFRGSIGRTDAYILGNNYGFNYGGIFDRVELKYANDKFAVTAGYGKLKSNGYLISPIAGVKTGYGEIERFFNNGSAVGVYYNSFNTGDSSSAFKDTLSHLAGAYTSINIGSKWNLLANYEKISYNESYSALNPSDSAELWIGKLTYGKTSLSKPHSWNVWLEYLNADDGAYFGSSYAWRFVQNNVRTWGIGAGYVVGKNAQFNVYQSFGSATKVGNAPDPGEQTRAEFIFAF